MCEVMRPAPTTGSCPPLAAVAGAEQLHIHWTAGARHFSSLLGSPREALRLTVAARLVNRAGTADDTAAVGCDRWPAVGHEPGRIARPGPGPVMARRSRA
jgi:hypothetical protein